MKYRDLIQFEPVTEVIQLRWADDKAQAEKLVSTYVISDRMADVILHRILPALRLAGDKPGRGLFVVGAYGSGKSHLMSVVTAIAEHPDLLEKINHPAVIAGLREIAGRFKVARQETSATEMHLRDVIFTQLEKQLGEMGVDFHFPSMQEASSNKELLIAMMLEFNRVYPGQGLLIALDELLDFLRARDDRQMVMDLNFLRELGEACEMIPLRFIAGIQEALFDNPRFQFAADSIRRVRARFDQLSIVREDLAYVVSRRLLAKTETQRRQVHRHLEKFTPLYQSMAERLDTFVDLFPIHPAYLEVFEQVTIGERRDLLKAVSAQMNAILDQELPGDHPGLIAFDAYWQALSDDPAYRTIPQVRLVQDKARVLAERIRLAPQMKDYRPAALRLIDALAVHRLTISDLYAPIGMTPIELRDRLCLHLPIPEPDADFLLATVETVLKEISRAVSGQFISHNRDNDQYYLDLKKDIDFDALIDQRAAALDTNVLNRYHFDVLAIALELKESTYVPGFRIWQREIAWPGQGITRQGYIFLGAPNERSTAHPERDFYIHFLGLNGGAGGGAEGLGSSLPTPPRPDEIYFRLPNLPAEYSDDLRRYAGAREMSAISSGSNKDEYDRKADTALRRLSGWLRENLLRVFQIQYCDETLPVTEAVGRFRLSLRELSFRDQVFRLSGAFLVDRFKQVYPDYPRFSGVEFTAETARQAAEAALRFIGGGPASRAALTALEGLGLLRSEGNTPIWTIDESPYARFIQDEIGRLEEGRVLNRGQLMAGEPGAERDARFGLEIEFLLVVLAALVRHGALQLNLPGLQIADGETESLPRLSLEGLSRFTSIARPRSAPEAALRELLAGLELDPALAAEPRGLEAIAAQLPPRVRAELERVVRLLDGLRTGPRFWREMALPPAEQQAARSKLEAYRQFLDQLERLNSPARLRALALGVGELRAAFKARRVAADLIALQEALQQLQPAVEYLAQAENLLPPGHPWRQEASEARREILEKLHDPERRLAAGQARRWQGRLENLQSAYAQAYFALHGRHRLDRSLDERKRRLTADARWARLRALGRLPLLSSNRLEALQGEIGELRPCPTLQPAELRTHAACPHCGFSPAVEQANDPAAERLERLEERFEQLYSSWLEALRENLRTPESQHTLNELDPAVQTVIAGFVSTGALPERITESFIGGLRDALEGLEKVTIDANEMLLALTRPGMPCTVDDFHKRLREYVTAQVGDKEPRKIRIHVEW